tara:strand:+ start:400 stop:609 length:210 start_codon:yes stop_codon:yes gene_type:complete
MLKDVIRPVFLSITAIITGNKLVATNTIVIVKKTRLLSKAVEYLLKPGRLPKKYITNKPFVGMNNGWNK